MKVGGNVRRSIATYFMGRLSVAKMHETSLTQENVQVLLVGGWEDGGRQVTDFPIVKLVINKTVC